LPGQVPIRASALMGTAPMADAAWRRGSGVSRPGHPARVETSPDTP